MEEKVNSYDMGAQIFPKSGGHIRMTRSKFYNKGLKILVTTVQNLVAMSNRRLASVHTWST